MLFVCRKLIQSESEIFPTNFDLVLIKFSLSNDFPWILTSRLFLTNGQSTALWLAVPLALGKIYQKISLFDSLFKF